MNYAIVHWGSTTTSKKWSRELKRDLISACTHSFAKSPPHLVLATPVAVGFFDSLPLDSQVFYTRYDIVTRDTNKFRAQGIDPCPCLVSCSTCANYSLYCSRDSSRKGSAGCYMSQSNRLLRHTIETD